MKRLVIFSILFTFLNKCAYGHQVFSNLPTGGSCFRHKLSTGNCVGIIKGVESQTECCKVGGFYLNRHLTQQEYLRDHLLFEVGSPNCIEACHDIVQTTCKGYVCPEDYVCQVVDSQPACLCISQCTAMDYESGPVCTSSLQQFRNRCQLKQARCNSAGQTFQEIPCSESGAMCAVTSSLSFAEDALVSDLLLNSSFPGQNLEPWLTQAVNKRGTIVMNRKIHGRWQHMSGRRMHTRRDYSVATMKRPSKTEIVRTDRAGAYHCPKGEYCLLQQYDGRPTCLRWPVGYRGEFRGCPTGVFSAPKCGTDNRTYWNECQLEYASLRKQVEIRIAYEGECRSDATCENVQCLKEGMSCRPHHLTNQPVCLDCASLPVDCNVSLRNGIRDDALKAEERKYYRTLGYPTWETNVQTNGWPMVCGSNGMTYSNVCFLHIVNCLSSTFVEFRQPQYCNSGL